MNDKICAPKHGVGAPDDGITPAMIDAGVAKLIEWETSSNPYPGVAVKAIYSAMRSVERAAG